VRAAPSTPTAAPSTPTAVLTQSDGYRISVLTMGPGDDFVTLFGHDAFLVEHAGLPSLVYNFGMYTEQAIAAHHVLGGTLIYYLSVDYLDRTLALYRAQNRSVGQQVLDLDRATSDRLAYALSLNSRPANTSYHYDFALDNCTTRVRDALDRALGGALHARLRGPARLSYRDHALRFTAGSPWFYFLFDLGLGRSADRPLDGWDDAFLPDRLAADLRAARITDDSGTHPLVSREITLFQAARPPARDRPPLRVPWQLALGLALGGLLFRLGGSSKPPRRVLFGAGSALLGTVVGVLGLLVLLLLGTDVHRAAHDNYNALVCPAWALAMLPGGLGVAFGRRSRFLAVVAGQAALLSLLGTAVAVLHGQDSWRVAALIVPALTGGWLGARAALRTA
jgi:hypothetical protein